MTKYTQMEKPFSESLLEIMKRKKVTQSRLATLSGVSRQSISDYVTGKRKNPEPEALKAMAEALQESPLTLYEAAGIYTPTETDETYFDRIKLILKRLSPQRRAELEEVGWLFIKLDESAPPQEGIDQTKK